LNKNPKEIIKMEKTLDLRYQRVMMTKMMMTMKIANMVIRGT